MEVRSNKLEHDRFPLCVSPDHVMGLLGYLSGLGGVADADSFNRASGVDLDLLPHALDAAEMLGLVVSESGYIMLTKLGKRFGNEGARHVRKELGELISGIAPFRDVVRALREGRQVRREEALEMLRKYQYGGSEEELERSFRCMLSWLLYAHLAEYDPEKDVLRPPRERRRST